MWVSTWMEVFGRENENESESAIEKRRRENEGDSAQDDNKMAHSER